MSIEKTELDKVVEVRMKRGVIKNEVRDEERSKTSQTPSRGNQAGKFN